MQMKYIKKYLYFKNFFFHFFKFSFTLFKKSIKKIIITFLCYHHYHFLNYKPKKFANYKKPVSFFFLLTFIR